MGAVGEEDKAASRVEEGLAGEECRGFPLVDDENEWLKTTRAVSKMTAKK